MCPAFAQDGEIDGDCAVDSTGSPVQFAINGVGTDRCDLDETPWGPTDDNQDTQNESFPWGAACDAVHAVAPTSSRNVLYYTLRSEGDPGMPPETRTVIGAGGMPVDIGDIGNTTEEASGQFLLAKDVGHFALLADPDAQELALRCCAVRDEDGSSENPCPTEPTCSLSAGPVSRGHAGVVLFAVLLAALAALRFRRGVVRDGGGSVEWKK